jgi:rhomboid family GlyGly-CTERM serine protease
VRYLNYPLWWRQYGFFAVLAVCAVLIQAGGEGVREWLRYDRSLMLQGQWWRVLTGHVAHLNNYHLWLNLGGLVLTGVLFGRCLMSLAWVMLTVACMLVVSAGLLIANPELEWYVGLSGVLHGLMVAGAVADIRAGQRTSWILLLFVLGKLGWEQIQGPMASSVEGLGARVVIEAHLYGGLGGVLLGWLPPVNRAPPTHRRDGNEEREPGHV